MKHDKRTTKKFWRKTNEANYLQTGKLKKSVLIGFYRLKLNEKRLQNLAKTIHAPSCWKLGLMKLNAKKEET
jgi:hypothetical protein